MPMEDVLRMLALELGLIPDEAVDDYRRSMAELPSLENLRLFEQAIWQSFLDFALESGGEHLGSQLIAWAWLAQAYRHTHAAFQLETLGFLDATAVHARVALEHGVYLSLLTTAENASTILDRLEHEYLRVVKLGLSVTDEVPVILDRIMSDLPGSSAEPGTEWVSVFKQVCDKLDSGDFIYSYYRALSSSCHPGLGSASPYMMAGFDSAKRLDAPELVHVPLTHDVQLTLWLAIGGCLWAGWSVDRLFGINHFGPILDPIAQALGFHRLVRVEPGRE
jgi:hypothetical protein